MPMIEELSAGIGGVAGEVAISGDAVAAGDEAAGVDDGEEENRTNWPLAMLPVAFSIFTRISPGSLRRTLPVPTEISSSKPAILKKNSARVPAGGMRSPFIATLATSPLTETTVPVEVEAQDNFTAASANISIVSRGNDFIAVPRSRTRGL